MRKRAAVRGLLAVAFSCVLATCGDHPESAAPTGPSAPTPVSLTIIGPGSIVPGQSVQFIARIQMSDGSLKDATPGTKIFWRSSNTTLLQVSSTGLATAGQQMGDLFLTAETTTGARGMTRGLTREIVITPEGTYRLTGDVLDSELTSQGLPGALIEITPGSITTTTDNRGGFRLYGIPPVVSIRVSRNGYEPATRQLHLGGHANEVFHLVATGPRLSLSGNYTLTVDANGCQPNMPTSLRRRQYDAVIGQAGDSLDVTLTESRFRVNTIGRGNRFSGRAVGPSALFNLESYLYDYYYGYGGPNSYPSVVERLPDSTHLVVQGSVFMMGSSGGLSGKLSGSLTLFDSRFPTTASFLGSCASNVLTLSPR